MTMANARPKCRNCRKAMVTCLSRPPHACPPQGCGYVHYGSGKHRCGPQAPATYAEPDRSARG